MTLRTSAYLACFLALGSSACSSSSDEAASDSCKSVDTTGCAVAFSSGASSEKIQTALIEAQSGDTVCFCPGKFTPESELSLNVPNVTVKGLGAAPDDVVIDYAKQTEGKESFSVTSDGFSIENLSLKNSPGNGIVVTGAENVSFKKLKVSWDAGSVTENGAYAVYPTSSSKVTIEDSEVIGAADAGIYVGQCNGAIVRNNKVHGNVAGIEIENTTDSDVYGNESYDNTGGILVFTLPNLDKKDGLKARVHDNQVHDNNRENFAESGSIVSSVPTGTGILIMAADDTQLWNNTIKGNESVGALIVSLSTLNLLLGTKDDPLTDPYPERTYLHGNTFDGDGQDPQGVAGLFKVKPLEEIVWDGVVKAGATDPALCLGDPVPTFRNFHAPAGLSDNAVHTTDPTPNECTLPDLPPLSW
jgi:parallel beta-helix repeat protein